MCLHSVSLPTQSALIRLISPFRKSASLCRMSTITRQRHLCPLRSTHTTLGNTKIIPAQHSKMQALYSGWGGGRGGGVSAFTKLPFSAFGGNTGPLASTQHLLPSCNLCHKGNTPGLQCLNDLNENCSLLHQETQGRAPLESSTPLEISAPFPT